MDYIDEYEIMQNRLNTEAVLRRQFAELQPFTVICNRCGSHNVLVTAFEHWDLEIKCKNCGAIEDCGAYTSR